MYRIRSGSGAEAVYNSLEEFNAAVRRGAVAPEDEIFHMRANRWLDVKSHPHYRLAISGAGHTDTSAVATSIASRPAPQAPAPRSAPTTPAASHSSAPLAAPVAERPQQTVLRPQLVPQSAPANPPGPPRKSRELAFIDLGGPAPSSQRNATVIEARKAPVPPSAPQKAEPTPAAPTSEVEFLVMDGGIESPVRNSQGLRTIPEDLDLLFDTPMHQVKPASTPTVVAAPTVPKAQIQAAPEVPVTKVERPAIEVTPRVAPKVEAPKVEAPKVEPPKAAAAVAAPKPAAPVTNAPKTEVATPAVAKLATPVAEPAHAPAAHAPAIPQAAPKAAVIAPAPRPAPVEDLTIPGSAILEAPVAPTAAPPLPELSSEKGPSMAMFAGAGLAVVMVVVGLLAWKPWSSHSAAPTTSDTAVVTPAPEAAAPTSAPAAVTPSGPAQTGPARQTTASIPAASKPTEPATRTDSVVKSQDDQIIAAARPNFQANADVPSADLELGTDIRAGTAAAQTVSPSELTRRLETAEKLAQLELGTKLGGFRSLFTPSRLATAEGVTAARNAWVSGAEVLRQYRAKIARMEKAYEDSVLTAQRGQRWSSEEMRAWAGHQDQAEPVETSQLADLMFSQVSEGLDLLAALDGQYEMKAGAIVFKNPASGTRYTSIRTWVDQRMQVWSGTPESARPYSVSAILRALGDGLPGSN